MGYRVAVVGATGNVGREMLVILEELEFPVDEIFALASRKSIGVEANYGDRTLYCQDIEQFDFSKVDLVLMSVSGVGAEKKPVPLGFLILENAVSVASLVIAPGLPIILALLLLFDVLIGVLVFVVLVQYLAVERTAVRTDILNRLTG